MVASKISALIAEAVGERPDGPAFDSWLQSRVGEGDAKTIHSTLDLLAKNQEAVTGIPSEWLANRLLALQSTHGEEVLSAFRVGELEPSVDRIAQGLHQSVAGSFGAALKGARAGGEVVPDGAHTPRLEALFKRRLGDPADLLDVASVVAALLPATREREASSGDPYATAPFTVAIDLGINGVKTAYQLATGTVDAGEARTWMANRVAAGVSTVAEKAIASGGAEIVATVGGAIGSLIGAAEFGAAAGRFVGTMAGQVVAKVVREQLPRVVEQIFHGVARGVETVVGDVGGVVSAVAGRLAGILR